MHRPSRRSRDGRTEEQFSNDIGKQRSGRDRDGTRPRNQQASRRDDSKYGSPKRLHERLRGDAPREQSGHRLNNRHTTTHAEPPKAANERSGIDPELGLSAHVSHVKALVTDIQASESEGETPPRLLISEAITAVRRVNAIVSTARWRETGESNPGRMMFAKKLGRSGLYVEEGAENLSRTVVTVDDEGLFRLVVKTGTKDRETVKSGKNGQVPSEGRSRTPQLTGAARQEVLAQRTSSRPEQDRHERYTHPEEEEEEEDHDDNTPLSVPYTTAASEFLYGAHSAFAALRARRRKLYKLYVHPRAFGRGTNHTELLDLAREAGVTVQREHNARLMDRMSDGRPHNGVVLEASRLPALPVLSLGPPDLRAGTIDIEADRQSPEDAAINGTNKPLSLNRNSWRHPFILLLDGILDPGNLGSILRTAHFYGVDAVAVATNTCSPLSSPIVAKASAGACEAVPLLSIPKPSSFVFESKKAGWKAYAAVAPAVTSLERAERDIRKEISTTRIAAGSPLANEPIILMLGAEGEGLRANLINRADRFVAIERGESGNDVPDVGVDSVNVGVAAGILMEAFLPRPPNAQRMPSRDYERQMSESRNSKLGSTPKRDLGW